MQLDIVVDNAGAIHEERRETEDGIEATFATMVVGPFVLAAGLLPQLSASRSGRFISVVSGGMYAQALPLDDLQFQRGRFDGTRAYARAKRAQTSIVREWSRRLPVSGPRFDAMHPGWADTPAVRSSLPGFHRVTRRILRSPAEGADTVVWLAACPRAADTTGRFFFDREERRTHLLPFTRESERERRELWQLCERLCAEVDA